jgi:hypothetical protein
MTKILSFSLDIPDIEKHDTHKLEQFEWISSQMRMGSLFFMLVE